MNWLWKPTNPTSGTYNIILNELVVEAHKPDLENRSVYEMLARRSFDSEYMEERGYTTIEEAIRSIAGLRISPNGDLSYRGQPVSIIIDDVPFTPTYDPGTPDAAQIYGVAITQRRNRVFSEIAKKSQIAVQRAYAYAATAINDRGILHEVEDMYPLMMIERIDFVGTALIHGSGGALSITTKNGSDITPEKPYGIKNLTPLGYQEPAEFYSPKYVRATGNASDGNDLRSTVYWNPDVQIDETGTATVVFHANDNKNTHYSVVVEGVTKIGNIINAATKIRKE